MTEKIPENEIQEFYEKIYLTELERENYHQKIYEIVNQHKYGENTNPSIRIIEFQKLFNENKCPSCGELILLKNEKYYCETCGLEIPLNIFEGGKNQVQEEKDTKEKLRNFHEKLIQSGYSENDIGKIKTKAYQKTINNLKLQDDEK